MHDIVGHNLSVMISVADGAATLAANRGEQSQQALRILGDTGRQAMNELRRVLGVLREKQHGQQPLSPQPGTRDLHSLLARVRTAGLDVTYRTMGNLATLSSSVQLTIYRIVQEALTNTLIGPRDDRPGWTVDVVLHPSAPGGRRLAAVATPGRCFATLQSGRTVDAPSPMLRASIAWSSFLSSSRSPDARWVIRRSSATRTAASARLNRALPLGVSRAGRLLPDDTAAGRLIAPISWRSRTTLFIACGDTPAWRASSALD